MAHVQKVLEDLSEPHKVSEADDESAGKIGLEGKSTAYGVRKALEARFEARHTTARVKLCKQFSQLKYLPKQQTIRELSTARPSAKY